MSHYAFRDQGDDLDLEADYVVVGSGAGGATAAVSLARAGQRVVVVEAGAWRDPEQLPMSAFGSMRDLMPDFGACVTRGRAFWPVVQGHAVGGTTVINSAICARTPDDIFVRWEEELGFPLGLADELRGYQDDLESELNAVDVPEAAWGRHNRLALLGARALGYENHVTKRYVAGCQGAGQCLQGCRASAKQSLNLTFIPETRDLGGIIVSCAPVTRVQVKRQRAVGVTGRFVHPHTRRKGARFTVRARRAVLMGASVTKSPVLLRRSGIRNRWLGRDFRSHPGLGLFGIYDDPVDMNTGATQGWASTAFRNNPGFKLETLSIPPELVASRLHGGGRELVRWVDEYRHMAMFVLALRAESTGRVRPGVFGIPDVAYTLNRADMLRLRSGLVQIARLHFAAGAKRVVLGIYGMPTVIGPDEVSRLEEAPLDPRAYICILSHLFGGCVFGTDPTRSVCDHNGRVHGVEGLVIVDASQIPTNLGVNPQHSIMSLARLRVRQLLDEQPA